LSYYIKKIFNQKFKIYILTWYQNICFYHLSSQLNSCDWDILLSIKNKILYIDTELRRDLSSCISKLHASKLHQSAPQTSDLFIQAGWVNIILSPTRPIDSISKCTKLRKSFTMVTWKIARNRSKTASDHL